jgi:hypothetical protein
MNRLFLLYHELRPLPSSYSYALECAEMDRHCELFASLRQRDSAALWPEITFDDGHRSNYEHALPILQRHGLDAHFFITAGWIGERAGYMDRAELRALHSAGQPIGAHGWSHKLLTHCSPQELDQELGGARKLLEDCLGQPVTTMSLPGGRMNRRVLEACWNAGYTEVFTSIPQTVPAVRPPRSTTGRLNIRSGISLSALEDLLQPGSGALVRLQRQERLKGAARSVLGDSLYARLWAMLNRQESETNAAETAPR